MTAAPRFELEKGLEVIRSRRRGMIYVFVGFLPFMLVAGYVVQLLSTSETPLIVAAIAYMLFLFAYAWRLAYTECPRCHGLYHWGNWWSNAWARKCLNCGLSLKAPHDGN